MPGLGTYSHTSDIIAPAGVRLRPVAGEAGRGLLAASSASGGSPRWSRRGGRLVWQFGENEELARIYLDDSLERGGYAAISTFHFGNPDFTNSEPFLNRYRGQIPFVALAGRARQRALVVRRHDDGLPHPLPRPRADLGGLARGAARTTGSSPSATTP